MLNTWNTRERVLAEMQVKEKGESALSLPLSNGAYVGQDLAPDLREEIYSNGARTAPGRENGGNIDIASLTRGTKMYLVSRRVGRYLGIRALVGPRDLIIPTDTRLILSQEMRDRDDS